MRIETITLSGLFEPITPTNMLSNFTRELDPTRFEVSEFEPWKRTFGNYLPELQRVSHLLAEHIRTTPRLFVLAGYSGGAHVIKIAMLKLNAADQSKVVRVVLAADPSMPSKPHAFDRVHGSTRRGASGIAADERVWLAGSDGLTGVDYLADVADPICQTPEGSPLHTLSAYLTSVSPDRAKMTLNLRIEVARSYQGRRFDLGAYREAIDLFDGYSRRGAHQRPYPPMLADLGREISRTATL